MRNVRWKVKRQYRSPGAEEGGRQPVTDVKMQSYPEKHKTALRNVLTQSCRCIPSHYLLIRFGFHMIHRIMVHIVMGGCLNFRIHKQLQGRRKIRDQRVKRCIPLLLLPRVIKEGVKDHTYTDSVFDV